MLLWLFTWLPRIGPFTDDTPLNEGNYQEAEWFTPIMQFNDRFGFIVWPLVGIGVIVAVVIAVLKASTHKSIPPEQRMPIKREILHELRRKLHGLSLEQLCQHVKQQREPLGDLVEEMIKDGMIKSDVNSKGAVIYRLPMN